MKIIIKNQKNGLENSNIKWYLLDGELWVTKYENYEDVEKSIANSEGSFNWLYEINDTVLFEKENGKFETAIIELSNKITTINSKNISIDGFYKKKGDIYLAEKKSYNFQFPATVIYEKKEDCLFSMQEGLEKEKVVILFITDDFGFVIEDDVLSGWVLKNASKHIYISQKYKDEFMDVPELLHCYFTSLNLYYENEDVTMMRELLKQLNDKEDAISLEIKECLEKEYVDTK